MQIGEIGKKEQKEENNEIEQLNFEYKPKKFVKYEKIDDDNRIDECLTDEIHKRACEMKKLFKDAKGYLSDEEEGWKSLKKMYSKFDSLVYTILTADNQITLHSGKDFLFNDSINADGYVYKYDFYINSNFIGYHSEGASTHNHLNKIKPHILLKVLGKHSEDIADVISNYNNKSDNILRMADVIKKYGYDKEYPSYNEKIEVDIDGSSVVREYERNSNMYSGEKKYFINELNKLLITVHESQSRYRSSSRMNLEFEYNKSTTGEKDSKKFNLITDLNFSELMFCIDNKDVIEKGINKALNIREKKINKFEQFLNEFREEFSSEILATRF